MPGRYAAERATYYQKNRDRLLAQQASYREANKDKIKARQKAYCAANKEKQKAYKAAHYKANREEIRKKHAAWRAENPHAIKRYRVTNRSACIQALGGRCQGADCYGWGDDPTVLDIDHVRGDGKLERVAASKMLEKIREEPSRFQLLCCNCHRRKTLANGEHKRRGETPNDAT